MKRVFQKLEVTAGRRNTVKPQFIVFIGGPEKEQWLQENNRCWGLYKAGLVQRPQKYNNGFGND
jgi:hypothetical protein